MTRTPRTASERALLIVVAGTGVLFFLIAVGVLLIAPEGATITINIGGRGHGVRRGGGTPTETGLWPLFLPAGIQFLHAGYLIALHWLDQNERASWWWGLCLTAFGIAAFVVFLPDALSAS